MVEFLSIMQIKHKFSKEEIDELNKHIHSNDLQIRERALILLNLSDSRDAERIGRIFRLTKTTVQNYLRIWIKERRLWSEEKGGSVSKLKDEQIEELKLYLKEKTFETVNKVILYVEEKYGIKYAESGMHKLLKRLNFSYKKPMTVPAKIDEEAQDNFVKEYNQLKNSKKEDELILFLDATHPLYQTIPGYGWIQKGETKTINSTKKQYRMNILGAIRLDNMDITAKDVDTVNAETVSEFLLDLSKKYEIYKKITIILDNAAYNKAKKLYEKIKDTNIELKFLPPYSPNLNAIERLWKILKKK